MKFVDDDDDDDTFLGHFGDGGVAVASARIIAAVRAHSVCGVE